MEGDEIRAGGGEYDDLREPIVGDELHGPPISTASGPKRAERIAGTAW